MLIILLIGIIVGVVIYALDLHIAIYRPKIPGRGLHFYAEIGSPSTSHLNIPEDTEDTNESKP
jgi:hypothetical protein